MSSGECLAETSVSHSLFVIPVAGGGPAAPTEVSQRHPSVSPFLPQGSPSGRRTRTRSAPPTSQSSRHRTPPGDLVGLGSPAHPPPPTPQPSHSEPAQEKARPLPSRDSWSNSGPAVEAGIRLPPPDPHRHALTELLCLSDPLGSGGYSTARGTGQGAERVYLSSSAGPVEYPSAPPPPASPSSGQAVAAAKATARYHHVTRPRGRCMPRDPVGREGRCLRP